MVEKVGRWGRGRGVQGELSKTEKNRKQNNAIWIKIKMIQIVWSSFLKNIISGVQLYKKSITKA